MPENHVPANGVFEHTCEGIMGMAEAVAGEGRAQAVGGEWQWCRENLISKLFSFFFFK